MSSTSTFFRRSVTTAPLSVRSGRSTSHRYLGWVVPLAVTMSVLFACTIPATAMRMSVTQCIPAPVSPSHMDLALIGVLWLLLAMTASPSSKLVVPLVRRSRWRSGLQGPRRRS
eukprot:6205688-Pleurochrysis_carterae.AAC.1